MNMGNLAEEQKRKISAVVEFLRNLQNRKAEWRKCGECLAERGWDVCEIGKTTKLSVLSCVVCLEIASISHLESVLWVQLDQE